MAQQQYDNSNRGVLFKNDRKESDNHPDYKGQINCDGVEFWLSAWIKEGQKGKFMSISVTPKDAAPAQPQRQAPQRPAQQPQRQQPRSQQTGTAFDDMDSDPPF